MINSIFNFMNNKNFSSSNNLQNTDKTLSPNSYSLMPDTFELNEANVVNELCAQLLKNFDKKDFQVPNDKILKNIANFDFTKYGKEGLPLAYPRKQYIKDLKSILETIDKDEAMVIMNKMQVDLHSVEFTRSKETFDVYDGFIDTSLLNINNPVEKKIIDISDKFLNKNIVKTGDDKVDLFFNDFIKKCPKFINIIGKKQHETHSLSVDIHIAEVLKNIIKDEQFNNLNNENKKIILFASLLHDIGKDEGVIDRTHKVKSAFYANEILEDFNFSESEKNKIVNFIQYHHWSEAIQKNFMTPEMIKQYFPEKSDFTLLAIFAKADIKAVSPKFYERFKEPCENSIKEVMKVYPHNS